MQIKGKQKKKTISVVRKNIRIELNEGIREIKVRWQIDRKLLVRRKVAIWGIYWDLGGQLVI